MTSYLKGKISSGFDSGKKMLQTAILNTYITNPIIKNLKEKKNFPEINYGGIIKELRPEIDSLIKTLQKIVQNFTIPTEEFNEILKKENLPQVDLSKTEKKTDLIKNLENYKIKLIGELKTLFETNSVIVQKGVFVNGKLTIVTAYNEVKTKNEKQGITAQEIDTNISNYKKELENLIATKVADVNNILDIADLVMYVNNPVIYDAQQTINEKAKADRKTRNDAINKDMNGIRISLCSPNDTTFECIRDLLGFSKPNFDELKKNIEKNGPFTTIFDFFLSSIRIAITNDLLQRLNRSISNITLNYKLNENEIKALKGFSDIFVEIINGFISVDFFKLLFEGARDEYKNYRQTQKGGADNDPPNSANTANPANPANPANGIELSSINPATEPSTNPATDVSTTGEPSTDLSTNPETNPSAPPLEPQSTNPLVKKDCDCNKIGQMNTSFNNILTNIINQLIKAPIKKHLTEYKTAMENIQKNMPNLFPDFLKDMFGYMILTLPINIVIFITSLIPIPLPYVMIQSLLNHTNKTVNDVLDLLITAARPYVPDAKNKEIIQDINNNNTKKEINDEIKLNLTNQQVLDLAKPNEEEGEEVIVGGKKTRRKRKYTKKYYLNRINNTIRQFYKTNKTRIKRKYL